MLTKNGQIAKTKTIAGKFKRLNYFHGMLLTEQDMQEEQAYFREKLKLHNRFHGSGVVWGLGLREWDFCKEETDDCTAKVVIGAGLALDCAGNEIVVCRDYEVSLCDHICELEKQGVLRPGKECTPAETCPKLYIGISYCECNSEPVQQYLGDCDDDVLHAQFSRVREGFCVKILREKDLPCCGGSTGPHKNCDCHVPCDDCPGVEPCCEEDRIVILGSVEIVPPALPSDPYIITAAQIDATARRRLAWTFAAPYWRWEDARQGLVRAVCQAQGWRDISGVVGRSLEAAQHELERLNMIPGEVYDPSQVDPLLLQQAKAALYCVPQQSVIQLITDAQGQCVLFAVPQPDARKPGTGQPRE